MSLCAQLMAPPGAALFRQTDLEHQFHCHCIKGDVLIYEENFEHFIVPLDLVEEVLMNKDHFHYSLMTSNLIKEAEAR